MIEALHQHSPAVSQVDWVVGSAGQVLKLRVSLTNEFVLCEYESHPLVVVTASLDLHQVTLSRTLSAGISGVGKKARGSKIRRDNPERR